MCINYLNWDFLDNECPSLTAIQDSLVLNGRLLKGCGLHDQLRFTPAPIVVAHLDRAQLDDHQARECNLLIR
jgi:hypothetical protein